MPVKAAISVDVCALNNAGVGEQCRILPFVCGGDAVAVVIRVEKVRYCVEIKVTCAFVTVEDAVVIGIDIKPIWDWVVVRIEHANGDACAVFIRRRDAVIIVVFI